MADGLNYIPLKPGPGLVEHIALQLEHQIVSGLLRSGDRVQETRVVGQLGVSRGFCSRVFPSLRAPSSNRRDSEAGRDCNEPEPKPC